MSQPIVIASLPKNARERVRVALDEYQGLNLIDLRVTVELTSTSGVHTPTKKGLSLRIEQLPALMEALASAHTRAMEMGMLEARR